MADLATKTYLFTDVGQIEVPESLAARINSIPKRRDGWWDQRYSRGKGAAGWFARIQTLARRAWVEEREFGPKDLPGFD